MNLDELSGFLRLVQGLLSIFVIVHQNMEDGELAYTLLSSGGGGVPNRGARPSSLALQGLPTPMPPPLVGSPTSPGSASLHNRSSGLNMVPEDCDWMEEPYFYEDYSEEEVEDYSAKPVPIWLSVFLVL